MGRTCTFTKGLAEEICERIAATPKGLDAICRENPTFPHPATIRRWLVDREEFRSAYILAREAQADLIFYECLAIADDASRDTVETKRGPMLDREWFLRSKLRVDTRMRMAAKLAPKKYGDRVSVSNTHEAGDSLQGFFDTLRAGKGGEHEEDDALD